MSKNEENTGKRLVESHVQDREQKGEYDDEYKSFE